MALFFLLLGERTLTVIWGSCGSFDFDANCTSWGRWGNLKWEGGSRHTFSISFDSTTYWEVRHNQIRATCFFSKKFLLI